MIIDVVAEKRTRSDREIFSYRVPEKLVPDIRVGSIVLIPFGKKRVRGVVVSAESSFVPSKEIEVKAIAEIDPIFTLPPEYLSIAKWISGYYLCSWGEALALFLPPEQVGSRDRTVAEKSTAENKELNRLSNIQAEIFAKLKLKLRKKQSRPALLFGVTASGKTEIYLHLAGEVIKSSKQIIVLVPEIILTPQLVGRFEEIFGQQVALMHSDLSKSERWRSYRDFYLGQKKILIGPRSALLVPSRNLGLIIVDEEGESAYKQEKNPKYQAVRLAEEIARQSDAFMLMGSATPTLESFYRAKQGEIDLYEMPARYQQMGFPPATVIDLKEEIRSKNFSVISNRLKKEIGQTLVNKEQIFLFLNRRGVATFVSCRECGTVILCPDCSVPLVYHLNQGANYLNCHHCDFECPVPLKCPTCGGCKIKFFGSGVEKIEQEIGRMFPAARIKRIDSKTFSSKRAYHTLYEELREGHIDILIGTQIIAKGFDLPAVGLVGVVSADVGLHLPYYKANERVFQLLTQISGRSGRGEKVGQTVIQTYWPETEAIKAAKEHNYRLFYDEEVRRRAEFGDPPFNHLIRVVVENSKPEEARAEIGQLAKEAVASGLEFIGPAKAFLSRLRGKYRYHLIIKTKQLPDQKVTALFLANPYLAWDVDPENLL